MSDIKSDLVQLREYQVKLKKSYDFKSVFTLLRFLRQSKLRANRLVSEYGYKLVTDHFSRVSSESEAYDIVEQVTLACLEVGKLDEADILITKLLGKFGNTSIRVQRLKAMLLEAQGTMSRANEIYTTILDKYPADGLSMKRQVSILISKGQYLQAITMLNTYIQIFMVDFEAWSELAYLQIKLLAYKNALFCFEELILTAPINYVFYVKYAELLYSIGGADNYILALKYFTHSLELNSPTDKEHANPTTNLTSIYGIIMSIFAYCNTSGGGSSKLREPQLELMEWAQGQLKEITQKHSPTKLPLVTRFLQITSINNN